MSNIKPIDLPWIFISFREHNANKNWLQLKKLIPHAKRSHGVKGYDQAHQAAAKLANCEFFFTLDGDSEVMEQWLYKNIGFELKPNFSWCWRSINKINGIAYGNGGVKLWHISMIENMNSHQNGVDFCWQQNYISLNEIAGYTDPGGCEKQAFVAGAREGIKLLLNQGQLPSLQQLKTQWNPHNRSLWLTWCTRGVDHIIHRWAPFGARYGACQVLSNKWHITNINDWDFLGDQFDMLQKQIANASEFLNTNENATWQRKFEQMGVFLEKILDLHVPSFCYDQFWEWLDLCYVHVLSSKN